MDKYLIDIPQGYQYCPDCNLLTPHTLHFDINSSKSMPDDWTCDICDHKKDGAYLCPRCGWEHDPDELAPVTIKVKKHTVACWKKQQDEANPHNQNELDIAFLEQIEYDCNCPEVDCYPIQHIFNYRSSPAPWQTECPNAREWTYDVQCKVCNYVYEVDDGNC